MVNKHTKNKGKVPSCGSLMTPFVEEKLLQENIIVL